MCTRAKAEKLMGAAVLVVLVNSKACLWQNDNGRYYLN